MGTKRVVGATGEQVAKRAFWLACQACGGPLGLGFLQDRRNVTEEDVWKQAREAGDYGGAGVMQDGPGEAYGDYVFGRMMKLDIKFTEDTVTTRDDRPTPDYQAWCVKYPSYDALIGAAAAGLGAKIEANALA